MWNKSWHVGVQTVQERVGFSQPRIGDSHQFIDLGFVLDLEEPNALGKLQQMLQGKTEAWSGGTWPEEPENHKAVEFSFVKSAGIFQASLFGQRLFLVKMGSIRHHFCAMGSCISQCSDTRALSFKRKQLEKDNAELQPLLGIFPKSFKSWLLLISSDICAGQQHYGGFERLHANLIQEESFTKVV